MCKAVVFHYIVNNTIQDTIHSYREDAWLEIQERENILQANNNEKKKNIGTLGYF